MAWSFTRIPVVLSVVIASLVSAQGTFSTTNNNNRVVLSTASTVTSTTPTVTSMASIVTSTTPKTDIPTTVSKAPSRATTVTNRVHKGFSRSIYNTTITEETYYGNNSILYPPVHAHFSSNAPIVYTIVEVKPPNPGVLSMDRKTGELRLLKTVDFESVQEYIVVIRATEEVPRGGEDVAVVEVTVKDVNDHEPVMVKTYLRVSVPENIPAGMDIVTVTATDADSGTNAVFDYELIDPTKTFTVDSATGVVRTTNTLDYERTRSYTIMVYAQETKSLERRRSRRATMVAVTVIDVNDNIPLFSQSSYEFYLPWPVKAGDFIGLVNAVDADSGINGLVRYKLIGPASSAFSINNVTGDITMETVSDDHPHQFTFLVESVDGGLPPLASIASVTVNAVDGYHRWSFASSSYIFNISENIPRGAVVGKVDIRATSTSTSVQFSLSKGQTVPFIIDQHTGLLAVSGALDRETRSKYEVHVEATDNKVTIATVVTVQLLDVNDNTPVFSQPIYMGITNVVAPEGSKLMTVSASDPDLSSNGKVTYALTAHLLSNLFTIDSETGVISLLKSGINLDQEVYNIDVLARDHGNPPLTSLAQVIIRVTETTSLWNYLYHEIPENSPAGSTRIRLLQGPFVNFSVNEFNFTIITGNDDGYFVINSQAELTTQKVLDFEKNQYFDMGVDVVGSKTGQHVGHINVSVRVLDVNDNAPVFISIVSPIHIPTSLVKDSPVYHFMATDADDKDNGNGKVSYTLMQSDSSFRLNPVTGELTTGSHEKNSVFQITVKASDQGLPVQTAVQVVTFIVVDPADGYPVFSPLVVTGSVSEVARTGSYVMRANAVVQGLATQRHHVFFTLVNDSSLFAVDGSWGDVATKSTFDREVKSVYMFGIQAQNLDKRSMSTTSLGYVRVKDFNDNPPYFPFSIYVTSIKNGSGSGTFLAQLKAFDKDENTQLSYTFVSGNEDGVFQFYSTADNKMVINLGDKFSRSSKQNYVQIQASDGIHYARTTLLVRVTS